VRLTRATQQPPCHKPPGKSPPRAPKYRQNRQTNTRDETPTTLLQSGENPRGATTKYLQHSLKVLQHLSKKNSLPNDCPYPSSATHVAFASPEAVCVRFPILFEPMTGAQSPDSNAYYPIETWGRTPLRNLTPPPASSEGQTTLPPTPTSQRQQRKINEGNMIFVKNEKIKKKLRSQSQPTHSSCWESLNHGIIRLQSSPIPPLAFRKDTYGP